MRNLNFTSDSPQSIKLGDSSSSLSLLVTESGQPVDLSKASSITVKIGNTAGYLTEIDVDVSSLIHPTIGRIDVAIESKISSELPAGNYLLEVWIDDALGNTAIYPDTSYPSVIGFSINKNIMTATSTVVTTLTLADFEAKFDDMQKDLQDKVSSGYFKGDKGTDGVDGKDGVGISSTVVSYQLSTSGTTTPTGAWSSTVLSPTTASPYLWVQTVITYSDSSTKTLYTISVKGDKGDKGDTGSVDNAGLITAPAFQTLQTQVNNSAVGTNLVNDSEQEFSGKAYGFNSYSLASITELTPGKTYTVSFSAKVDDKAVNCKQNVFVCVYNPSWSWGPMFNAPISTDYQRVTNTFTVPEGLTDANSIAVYLSHPVINGTSDPNYDKSDTAGTGYIKKFKLEEGSVATPWCPNPSEILTQSDYAKIKAAIVALGGSLS